MSKPKAVPEMYKSTILATARHEAGHFAIAQRLGFSVDKITLKCSKVNTGISIGGGSAITLGRELNSVESIADYLRRRAQILYAGVLAESLIGGKTNSEKAVRSMHSTATDDHSKVREIIHILRSIIHGAPAGDSECQQQLDTLDQELWLQASVLVEQNHVGIEQMGSALAKKVKLVDQPYELCKADALAILDP